MYIHFCILYLHKKIPDYNYTTLDNPLNRNMAEQDPELFLENFVVTEIVKNIISRWKKRLIFSRMWHHVIL